MLSSFIIALREGLEAALIIGILVAYVVKSNKRAFLRHIWSGVFLAIIISLGLGAILTFTSAELGAHGEQIFAGTTSFLAVALVTWMVFWMKRTARTLRTDLAGKIENAFSVGPYALAGVAFLAVVREGLETSLFVYANFKSSGDPRNSTLGLIIGFIAAIVLGYLIYKSAIHINLSNFFTYTGIALIIVAAGLLSHAVFEFQEIGFLPGAHLIAIDIHSILSPDSFSAVLLSSSIGLGPTTSWLQLAIYVIYLVAVITRYLNKSASRRVATT